MNPSVLQPLLELLNVANPADLTDQEITRFRAWLQDAYRDAGKETTVTAEVLPDVQAVDKPINTQPTSAHVDRVMQTLLVWEGGARKRMARRGLVIGRPYRTPRVARSR
jgi:hypothetical protein